MPYEPQFQHGTIAVHRVADCIAGSIDGIAAEFRSDVEYADVDGENLKLDASVPDGVGPFPIAILIHGGGWGGGDKAREHVPPTEPLTDANFTWFSINYRLAPKHRWPACIDDVRTAIRWVKAHAAEYKGDPDRIALIGYSAGGHLAAFAAVTAEDDTRVQAVVLLAGPTDLVADCERRGGLSPSLQALFNRGLAIDDDVRTILRDASPIVRRNCRRAALPACPGHGGRKCALFAVGELPVAAQGVGCAVRADHDPRRLARHAALGRERHGLQAENDRLAERRARDGRLNPWKNAADWSRLCYNGCRGEFLCSLLQSGWEHGND